MIKTFRKFFDFAGSKNKKLLKQTMWLGIVRAVFQALKIPAVYLIVEAVAKDEFNSTTLAYASLIMVVSVLGSIVIYRTSSIKQTIAGYRTAAEKRIEIAEHMRYLPMGYFNEKSLGYITSVATNTMEQMGDVATRVIMMTTKGLLESLLITIYLIVFDWRIGTIGAVGILLFLLVNRQLRKANQTVSERKLKADSTLVEETLEYIHGIVEVKTYGLTKEKRHRLNDSIDMACNKCIELENMANSYIPVQNIIVKLTGLFMSLASIKFYVSGTMDLSISLVMIVSSFMLFSALEETGSYSALLRIVDMSVDRAKEILNLKLMDIDGKEVQTSSQNIEIKDIEFAYDKKQIINNISLNIPEKTTAAFVGPSGGGKTTLCHLIARFWDVDSGQVKLDGIDVKDYSMDSLMKNYSFVFQKVYLFHDSIFNNISFGKPDIEFEKVVEAAKKACCHDFIMALPDGYNTIIGEGGTSLSGGECQRISIARAIMKDSPIIILDEATANVDPENEKELTEAIYELTKDKTILMIAHRLRTVKNADQIFVVDNGSVVQKGAHEELLSVDGIYRNFINSRRKAVSWKL